MNRAEFFRRMLGLVGVQLSCIDDKGYSHPCKLKPGEELCPLGHVQKPRYVAVSDETFFVDKNNHPITDPNILIQSICSVCGIVYVKQEKP